MSRRRRRGNYNTLFDDRFTYHQIYNRLLNIAVTSIRWEGLPEEINELFMEYTINVQGSAVFFSDDVVNQYICLTATHNEPFNIYNVPQSRMAYAVNGYQQKLNGRNSVIIYNNYTRSSVVCDLTYYAKKLYNIQRTIDINVNAQKTPLLIACKENEKLTLQNIYMEYDGNAPVIKGYKDMVNTDSIKVLKTDAPYLADKLELLYQQVWNEALTYLGISNTIEVKKERMISGELESVQGHVLANRRARLSTREMAAKEIKNLFGLQLTPKFVEPAMGLTENVSRETSVADGGMEEGDE